MDIMKNSPKAYTKHLVTKLVIILFCIGAAVTTYTLFIENESIDRNLIVISKVTRGNLDIVVDGYGIIESNSKQLITSQSDATVKEIIIKAGDRVKQGAIILKMENSFLTQRVNIAELELVQEEANLRQISFNQQREILVEDSKISELEASYRSLKFIHIAQEFADGHSHTRFLRLDSDRRSGGDGQPDATGWAAWHAANTSRPQSRPRPRKLQARLEDETYRCEAAGGFAIVDVLRAHVRYLFKWKWIQEYMAARLTLDD